MNEHRRSWSVRRHLAVIVIAVTVVFLGVGAVLARQTWTSAQSRVRAEADYTATFAAGLLRDSAAVAQQQAVAIAANPSAAPLLVDPSACTLDFQLDLFPGSHLDLVRSDGSVACSSADLTESNATQAGAPWLAESSDTPLVSGTFVDGVTKTPAVAFVAPIESGGQVVGHVAVVVPTNQIAGVIAKTYGGRRQFQFTLVDSARHALLSSSRSGTSADDPLPGFLSETASVAQTPWTITAGVDPGAALAATRAVLLRGVLLGACVLLVLVGSMVVVNRRIGRPLADLTRVVHAGGPDLAHALEGIDGPEEIAQLATEFQVAIADRDAFETQLAHVRLHDPLTGLANRALLIERLGDFLEVANRNSARVAVLYIDLDRFKLINDSLGHDAGDHVLTVIARRINDSTPGAIVARFGGDEFVVAVEVLDDRHLDGLLDRLLKMIGEPIETDATLVRMSASVGVATSTSGRRGIELIRDADNAMHAAKDAGRARAHRFTSRLHDKVASRYALAADFRHAADRGELSLAYQPKVDLISGDIVGVESLLRWKHPALGFVPPSTFIPIAEETDTIIQVGQFVLEEACRQAMEWRNEGLDLSVAVNVSGRQLTDGDLPLHVATALALFGIPPESLYLELTETLLMADTLVTQSSMRELSNLGVKISIDDFGTGYSSLAYLHRFRVDELKIDRAFVNDLTTTDHATPLVAAMVAMGQAFGLEVVAEGVETTSQAALLRELGCQRAQGYLYARPEPGERIALMVRTPAVRR